MEADAGPAGVADAATRTGITLGVAGWLVVRGVVALRFMVCGPDGSRAAGRRLS